MSLLLIAFSLLADVAVGGIGHFHAHHSWGRRSSSRMPLAQSDHQPSREERPCLARMLPRRRDTHYERNGMLTASEWIQAVRGGSDYNDFGLRCVCSTCLMLDDDDDLL